MVSQLERLNKQLAELQELVATTTNPILNESTRSKQPIDAKSQQTAVERNQDEPFTKEHASQQTSPNSVLCPAAEVFHLRSTTVESLKSCKLGNVEVTPQQILDLFNL